MTELTTPTDEVVETPTGSEQSDLPVENTNEPAVESVGDTASEDNSETGSNDSNTEESQAVDDDLKRFAKSQGYSDEDLKDLTPREVKALGIAHKQVKETRKKLEQENKGAIEKEINQVDKESELADREYLEFRLKQRDMVDNIREYWRNNQDDAKYEAEAVAILQAEKEKYGVDAMLRLAENMPRLVREAKYNAGAFDPERFAEQGRKEERERLNKLQSGSADSAHATTSEAPSKNEVTVDWIKNEYDVNNPEHRAKLDKFMASGRKPY
jgi:phage-related protein